MCALRYVTEVGEQGVSDLDYMREAPLPLGGAWLECDPCSESLAPRWQRAGYILVLLAAVSVWSPEGLDPPPD